MEDTAERNEYYLLPLLPQYGHSQVLPWITTGLPQPGQRIVLFCAPLCPALFFLTAFPMPTTATAATANRISSAKAGIQHLPFGS